MISRRFHLIIDAVDCPESLLDNAEFLESTIKDVASIIKMKIIDGPRTIVGETENPGLTSVAIIDFSNIIIHTFTKTREFCLDIFSCKPFEYKKAYDFIKMVFDLDDKNLRTAIVKYNNELRKK